MTENTAHIDTRNVVEFHHALVCNRENPVIHDLDLTVSEGEFVYITGRVGSGKTSLVRTIMAENPLIEGEGRVCGFDLRKIREKDIAMLRRRMGVVFQDFQLLMEQSVHDNLQFVLRSTGWKDRAEMEKRIRETLRAVGMETKIHRMPYQLSGGEQQRVAIARALLNSPDLIIADEPTGNLDEETAEGIMKLVRGINSTHGTAVIMITHNNTIVKEFPGRLFVCGGEKCVEA